MITLRLAAALLLAALAACTAPQPLRTALPVIRSPSPNFDARRPGFVILHHTGSADAAHALATLTDSRQAVSAHYLVARNGTIHYLVDEMARAWHAGDSSWGGHRDMNSASIGVEIDNDGEEPYAEAQLRALLALLADLKQRWKVPAANFLGHGDVAPGRKVDPGAAFPWKRLAESGFGVWCDPPYPPVPAGLDTATMLAALGYDAANLEAAVAAFKRRFVPGGNEREITADDRARLWCLLGRRQGAPAE